LFLSEFVVLLSTDDKIIKSELFKDTELFVDRREIKYYLV